MGNSGSRGANGRRRHGNRRSHPPPPSQPDITSSQYVFAAAPQYPTPHPSQYYQFDGYYPPPRVPLPAPFSHHSHHQNRGAPAHSGLGNWVGGRYSYPARAPAPYIEHQKAVTIRNDVNLKKETLRVEPDEENPGKFLVAFTFDATIAGSIAVIFFAKEEDGCKLTPMKEDLLPPVTVHFQQGLGQKFKQPSGTGIDFSMFEETELRKEGELDIFPLAVKAEASSLLQSAVDGSAMSETGNNSQITHAVFEKEKGKYRVMVLKQILWVHGMRYELQEIYGIGNSVESDLDSNELGKECVICLTEPSDTTVLPCRHMCMCSGCAKLLRFQTNRCPICRQEVERLLEIKLNKCG